jgi:hypothetical protein
VSAKEVEVGTDGPVRTVDELRELDAPRAPTSGTQAEHVLVPSSRSLGTVAVFKGTSEAALAPETAAELPGWRTYYERRLGAMEDWAIATELPGAESRMRVSIETARSFADHWFPGGAFPCPSVVAEGEASINLVWFDFGWHAEVVIDRQQVFVWAHNLGSGKLWRGRPEEHTGELRDLFSEFSVKAQASV